jgi:dynein heavy chain
MVTLTWTSMNIDQYLKNIHKGLQKLDNLIIKVNDVIENRIENNLKKVSKVLLVCLPDDTEAMSLDQFVKIQEDHISNFNYFLMSKNEEVERAVDDLIQVVMFYELDPHIIEDKDNIHIKEAKKIKKYYFWYLY